MHSRQRIDLCIIAFIAPNVQMLADLGTQTCTSRIQQGQNVDALSAGSTANEHSAAEEAAFPRAAGRPHLGQVDEGVGAEALHAHKDPIGLHGRNRSAHNRAHLCSTAPFQLKN